MTTRTVLHGEKARKFYAELPRLGNFTGWPANFGGFWAEDGGGWFAFDTTTGECYCEPFSNSTEAKRYARGELATTSEGVKI